MKRIIGTNTSYKPIKLSINLLGEYNIGGDGWEIERVLEKIGYEIVAVMTGDGSTEALSKAHTATLNLVQCHRSINYIAEMMKTKYGMDWIKVNFLGVDGIIKSLRDIAAYFGDADLSKRTEEVIAEELAEIEEERAYYRKRLKGRTAALYVGGSRSHHYQMLLKDFGMETIIAGYEFAHRDDYEGRDVIPSIKEDADNKNIETITVSKDPDLYHEFYPRERLCELKTDIEIDDYAGMIPDMDAGNIVVDDYNHFETDELIKHVKPDIFFSGIKDKHSIQKAGVASRQMHSYDYSGPYAGFRGAVNFGRDAVMALYTNAWKLVTPPWKHTPMLVGTLTGGAE
jgi:nitrogenase molybdenum-iron protein alpha chain